MSDNKIRPFKPDSMLNIFSDIRRGIDLPYRVYRLKWSLFPKIHYVSSFPISLNIESTSACNLRCKMCYNNDYKVSKGYMSFPLYKKVIDECSKYHLRSIKLSWRGEPLLHPNIVEMIAYAKTKNILEVSLNTSATLLDSKLAEDIIDAGLDRILFSVDGGSKESYESIRIGANYDSVVRNIDNFLEINNRRADKSAFVRIQFVKMDSNEKDIPAFVSKWENKIKEIVISPDLPNKLTKGVIEKFGIVSRKPCDQLWQRMAIAWNGDVSMCCIDWPPDVVVGNVNNESLYNIWHGDKLNEARRMHKLGLHKDLLNCKDCAYLGSHIFTNENGD